MKSRAPSLLDLPVELLDKILGYAYWIHLSYDIGRYRPISICRALQPSLDRVRYRVIPCLSSTESAILLRAIEARPELGFSCQRLHLNTLGDKSEDEEVDDTPYDSDILARLFALMPTLRHLDFTSSQVDLAAILALTSQGGVNLPLSNIETISISLHSPTDRPPFVTDISPFMQYHRLTTLSVDHIVDEPLNLRLVTSGGQPCPSLVKLEIAGDLPAADVHQVLRSGINFQHFIFTDFSTPTLIRTFALPVPMDTVCILHINQGCGDDGESIDRACVLAGFSQVRDLTVNVGNLRLSSEAVRILRARPRLDVFSLWLVERSIMYLATFLNGLGPAHAPRHVDLESRHFYWSYQGRLPRPGDQLDLSDAVLQTRNSWFRRNMWTVPYPLGDTERSDLMWRLREEAARCGISFTGNVAMAAYVQDVYDEVLKELRRGQVENLSVRDT